MRASGLLVVGAVLSACSDQGETQENEAFCRDCDGIEVVMFEQQLNAMNHASDRCGGGPVELVDNSLSGLNSSDYRCRR